MTSPQGGALARLTNSLQQWRDARLNPATAGQAMADAIEQFLQEAEGVELARHRALNPSETLLQALETRHQQRLEWQAMRKRVQ